MRGAAAAVAGLAVVAGVVLGLAVTSSPADPAGPVASASSTVPAPSGATPRSPTVADAAPSSRRVGGCVDATALVPAYAADQAGDARSVVVPGSVRCAGQYATAKVSDPSLPDQLNVLFAVSPLRKLREGTGPVCEVGSGEGGLPTITAAQGEVLNCA